MTEQPLHLAIIPDGNRRWARKRALQPWKGHEQAIDVFRSLVDWCRESPQIGVLTLWCFSTENWKRNPIEVSKLMGMLEKYLINERAKLHENQTRLLHSGRTDRIPASLAALLKEIIDETAKYDEFTLHLALDYGGKDEIVRAIGKLDHEEQLDEATIRKHLDQPDLPDIDLIVRTSGEQRTSNFCLWQSAYAEWFFLEKFFPDLTTNDIETALQELAERKRRFGG